MPKGALRDGSSLNGLGSKSLKGMEYLRLQRNRVWGPQVHKIVNFCGRMK